MNSTSTTTSCSKDFEENDLIYGELNTHDKGSEVHLAYEGRNEDGNTKNLANFSSASIEKQTFIKIISCDLKQHTFPISTKL
jgi:hypothetical protein